MRMFGRLKGWPARFSFHNEVVTAGINTPVIGGISIVGTAVHGSTLTTTLTISDADGVGAISYQWYSSGIKIEGANGNQLTLTPAEVGKAITVAASYTDGGGSEEVVFSAPTSPVLSILSYLVQTSVSGGGVAVQYDIADLASLSQDTAGAVPATAAGQTIGRVADKSGLGYHLVFGNKPVLQYNATTANWYLDFDGIDDHGVTPNILFNTTNFTLAAGVRKLTDAAVGLICELGTDANTQPGAFYLSGAVSAGTPEYGNLVNLGSNGTAQRVAGYAAPHSASLILRAGTAQTPKRRFRVNGAIYTNDASLGTTGLSVARPLHVGRRAGTSLPMRMHLYQLCVIPGAISDAETALADEYIRYITGAS